MITDEAVPGVPVRMTLPDGTICDDHGVIDHPEGRGAYVNWTTPAQPVQSWVPDIAWLILDDEPSAPEAETCEHCAEPISRYPSGAWVHKATAMSSCGTARTTKARLAQAADQ